MAFSKNLHTDFVRSIRGLLQLHGIQMNYLTGIQRFLLASFCIFFSLDFLKWEESVSWRHSKLNDVGYSYSISTKMLQHTLIITHSPVIVCTTHSFSSVFSKQKAWSRSKEHPSKTLYTRMLVSAISCIFLINWSFGFPKLNSISALGASYSPLYIVEFLQDV